MYKIPSKCRLGTRAWSTLMKYYICQTQNPYASFNRASVTNMYLETQCGRLELIADHKLGPDDVVMNGITLNDFISEDILLGVCSE
jgi:hypothetical protein